MNPPKLKKEQPKKSFFANNSSIMDPLKKDFLIRKSLNHSGIISPKNSQHSSILD